MQCPKCGGEAYLVEEELVQVLENLDPPKIIAKAIYQCRSCGDRFTRLISESLDSKRKVPEPTRQQATSQQQSSYLGENIGSVSTETRDKIDNLKFY